eukprot:GHRR01029387.1.p1 GENE.GHRR01029387.1~~GHRR01029387.1.p1  ORF type:complete len:121 (-),score=26.33 GHRR01029387.1:28-390(-)
MTMLPPAWLPPCCVVRTFFLHIHSLDFSTIQYLDGNLMPCQDVLRHFDLTAAMHRDHKVCRKQPLHAMCLDTSAHVNTLAICMMHQAHTQWQLLGRPTLLQYMVMLRCATAATACFLQHR